MSNYLKAAIVIIFIGGDFISLVGFIVMVIRYVIVGE